jgi:hypothetical protein
MARGEERTSSAALLIPIGLCGALAVIALATAVGAVVPAVGDAVSVDSRGVGGMFGYLGDMRYVGDPPGARAARVPGPQDDVRDVAEDLPVSRGVRDGAGHAAR